MFTLFFHAVYSAIFSPINLQIATATYPIRPMLPVSRAAFLTGMVVERPRFFIRQFRSGNSLIPFSKMVLVGSAAWQIGIGVAISKSWNAANPIRQFAQGINQYFTRIYGVVKARVFLQANEFQVFVPVVRSVFVFVMDMFITCQGTPKTYLHHKAMLVDESAPRKVDLDISIRAEVTTMFGKWRFVRASGMIHDVISSFQLLTMPRDVCCVASALLLGQYYRSIVPQLGAK